MVFFLADPVANKPATILAINLNQRSKYHADHVAQAVGLTPAEWKQAKATAEAED